VRIFAYFGVCNGFVTKTKHDLTRPQNSCKTWRSRKSGNQKTTRGNTMENVTISKEALQALLEIVIDYHEYEPLSLSEQDDRKLAAIVQLAVDALGDYEEKLQEKRRLMREESARAYQIQQADKAAAEAAAK
jgi:hypothetical protein